MIARMTLKEILAAAATLNLASVKISADGDELLISRNLLADMLRDTEKAQAEIARLREEMGRTADAAQWALDLEFERHAESKAEIATLRAKIAAVQDVVNSTTIRTRIDEAWVEKLCRALDAMPAIDVQDKANFAETQTIRYVRK